MNNIKISHESPLCLLEDSLDYNDYDYALVHLFEEYPEYYNFFKRSVNNGRHVLLDNSLYELGEAFDTKEYIEWIKKLKPTEYIVPDVLNDKDSTIDRAREYSEYDIPGKKIGVVHGRNFDEYIGCYLGLREYVDKIAFNFMSDTFISGSYLNKDIGLAINRMKTIKKMHEFGILDKEMPHHLLGATSTIEFRSPTFHKIYKQYIETADTSSPVMCAINNTKYDIEYGVFRKPYGKINDNIEIDKDEINIHALYYNIKIFRTLIH